jgi:two-component system sensor histidine kinase ChiS
MQPTFRTGLWIVFCLMAQSLLAQTPAGKPRFQHLSLEQGISSSAVYTILQDRKGFIWLGTQDGLNKYDGYTVTVFRSDPADTNSLCPGYIRTIYEDKYGMLWIGSDGGLTSYQPESGRFTRYSKQLNASSNAGNKVWAIEEDRSGTLWVAVYEGDLYAFQRKNNRFIPYTGKPGQQQRPFTQPIWVLHADQAGTLWIGTQGGGLYALNSSTGKLIHYEHNPKDSSSISGNVITCLSEDHAGRLWIGTEGAGLNRLDKQSGRFTRFLHDARNPNTISDNKVWSLCTDRRGILWIGLEYNGLNVLNPETNQVTRYQHNPQDNTSLSSNDILGIFEDRAGMLWIGTYGGGLNLLDRRSSDQFLHFKNSPQTPNMANLNVVRGIFQDRSDRIWLSSMGELQVLKKKNGELTQESNPIPLKSPVQHLIEDSLGKIWLGTLQEGLVLYDPIKQQLSPIREHPKEAVGAAPRQTAISGLLLDGTGTLWVGTEGNGLRALDTKTRTWKVYQSNPLDPHSLSQNYITSLVQDQEGVLWIGTFGGGLCAMDRERKYFTRYLNNLKQPTSLSNNQISCLYQDPAGRLWVGTFGGGLNRLDKKTGAFVHFTEKDGLPNNVINGILSDVHGNLWLSTNEGIARFKPLTSQEHRPLVVKSFDGRDGLQSNEFNMGAFHLGKDGWMYFGGINGVNAFHPDSVKSNTFVPPVVITQFKVFEKPYLLDTLITSKQHITLSYLENFFSFEFAALNYILPEKNQYAYRMVGFDPDWIPAGTRRYASYTNLPSGTYTFQVKASNNDGIWNEQGRSLIIVITPPFWKTWWFRTVILLALMGVLYSFYRVRLQQERRRGDLAKWRAEAETRALRAQMNPHFIFNCMNTIDAYILTNRPAAASEFLQKFSQLVRQVLENSRHSLVLIAREMEVIKLYMELEEERAEHQFHHVLEVDPALPLEQYLIPPMVLQPFAENAILHGLRHQTERVGLLRITLKKQVANLRVVLEDNGIGRAAAERLNSQRIGRHSLGTSLTVDHVKTLKTLYGTETEVTITDLKVGTRVEIILPLIQADSVIIN